MVIRVIGIMNTAEVVLLLLFAAAFEAGGDALVRSGLHGASLSARLGLILLGGIALLAYGITVNLAKWDFGRLLGVYVSLFFLLAQVINACVFATMPTRPVLLGGALIIAGGAVITFWQPA